MKFNLKTVAAVAMVAAIAATPSLAFAQAGDPFAKATTGAASFRESLTQFALVVGGIGMVACLMLGFFGKPNWKWVSTGIGVSFALAIVPAAIGWVSGLAGYSIAEARMLRSPLLKYASWPQSFASTPPL